MAQGFFITFEGLDGSGKTTQLKRLAERLQAQGRRVVSLRQPGGTALGTRIRSLLVDSRTDTAVGPVSPLAELALMFADRAQAIAEIIRPALAEGAVVLCDRFTDSSLAYQGAGRELGSQAVQSLHQTLCAGLEPDLTLLLLPPLAVSLRRARRRNLRHLERAGTDENRFESEPDSFYERAYAAYLQIAQKEPGRVVSITEPASIDDIEQQIAAVVLSRLAAAV